MVKRCLILGSGSSLKEGLNLKFKKRFENEITFSINDNVKFFNSTVYTFGDWTAYASRFNLYKKQPLVIGRYDTHFTHQIEGSLPCPKHDGLILLQSSGKWNGKDSLKKGIYSPVLTGIFTLNLAIRLGFIQIFLLGFDLNSTRNKTHFYEDVPGAGQYTDYEGKLCSGVGKYPSGEYKTSVYNNSDVEIDNLWKPFEEEFDTVKIYNVSLDSRIQVFKKIGYNTLFKILKEFPLEINQQEAQNEIREILTPYNRLTND